MDLHKFDKRIIKRLIEEGRVKAIEYNLYKDNLEDLQGKSEDIFAKIFINKKKDVNPI